MEIHQKRKVMFTIILIQCYFLMAFTLHQPKMYIGYNAVFTTEENSEKIKSTKRDDQVYIYTDFVAGVITISIDDLKYDAHLEYLIMNAKGLVMCSDSLHEANTILSVRNLPAGAYLIRIIGNELNKEEHFLIQ